MAKQVAFPGIPACPLHGPITGLRYCPECCSDGKPWTEAQADTAAALALLECPACRHRHQGEALAFICIGCACEKRPPFTRLAL